MPDIQVDPSELYPVKGWHRTSRHILNDTYRWEGFGSLRALPGVRVSLYSFDTMTNCVRHGVNVVRDTPTSFDVDAKSRG